MPVTDARNLIADLLNLLADNTSGGISEGDVRAIVKTFQVHEAAGAPTATDDSANGYDINALWIDASVTPKVLYRCYDNTAGAAVWKTWLGPVGNDGESLVADSSVSDGVAWAGARAKSLTAAYTLTQADNGYQLECDGTFTVTLPVNLSVGFECAIINVGTGIITLAAGVGATLNATATTLETTDASCYVYSKAGDAFHAIGQLGTPTASGLIGPTASRPTPGAGVTLMYFDTTLGKPVFWTGASWVDATGAAA